MDMYEEEEGFVFELSREETDKLFEPFRNEGLTMKEWKAGYRFMKADVEAKFNETIGQRGDTWWHDNIYVGDTGDRTTRELWFLYKKDAMMFKLMYPGL